MQDGRSPSNLKRFEQRNEKNQKNFCIIMYYLYIICILYYLYIVCISDSIVLPFPSIFFTFLQPFSASTKTPSPPCCSGASGRFWIKTLENSPLLRSNSSGTKGLPPQKEPFGAGFGRQKDLWHLSYTYSNSVHKRMFNVYSMYIQCIFCIQLYIIHVYIYIHM